FSSSSLTAASMTCFVEAASIGAGDSPRPTTACAVNAPPQSNVASNAHWTIRLRNMDFPREIASTADTGSATRIILGKRCSSRLERTAAFGTSGRPTIRGRRNAHDAAECAREMALVREAGVARDDDERPVGLGQLPAREQDATPTRVFADGTAE